MSERRNWFKFYPADYLLDTTDDWPYGADGVYIRLLCHQWKRVTLPLDLKRLARLVKVHPVPFKKLWDSYLVHKFDLLDNGWQNKRLQREREDAEREYFRKSSAGKKGAEATRQSRKQADTATPVAQPVAIKKEKEKENKETEREEESKRLELTKRIHELLGNELQVTCVMRNWDWSDLDKLDIKDDWVVDVYRAVFDPDSPGWVRKDPSWLLGVNAALNLVNHYQDYEQKRTWESQSSSKRELEIVERLIREQE